MQSTGAKDSCFNGLSLRPGSCATSTRKVRYRRGYKLVSTAYLCDLGVAPNRVSLRVFLNCSGFNGLSLRPGRCASYLHNLPKNKDLSRLLPECPDFLIRAVLSLARRICVFARKLIAHQHLRVCLNDAVFEAQNVFRQRGALFPNATNQQPHLTIEFFLVVALKPMGLPRGQHLPEHLGL